MAPRDLREWIALLEREGELVRVGAEVDPYLEITEITDRVVKAGGPALLFENVKGSPHPLLINQYGSERRTCLAFDATRLDAVADRLEEVLDMQPPLPKHVDELMLAGCLRGEAVELVKGVTVDVEVPANAEIVLEGYVERGDEGVEGPFGDHTGYYSPAEPFPVFHVTAMTMRRGAIYPSIVVGKPPAEDGWLGKATERIFLPAIRMSVPEIVDYDLPVAGAFHNCVIVSIRKRFPGHAQKVMHAIWGLGLLSLTKAVVVVDEWVDVHDYEEGFFRVCANVDPKRDVVLSEGPLDHLDHAPTRQFYGGKIGIDATHKSEAEGARPWPEEIRMTDEVQRRVDERWEEYGLGAAAAAENGRRSALRQLLRR